MKKTSKSGRYTAGKQYVPRSATFEVGKAPMGQHATFSKQSKKRGR